MLKSSHYFTLAVTFITSVNLLSALPTLPTPEGFTALFNGIDLTGWHGDNPHNSRNAKERKQAIDTQQTEFKQHWTVKDGILVNDGKGPYATTDQDYRDFELQLEYRMAAKVDSGIYLRGNPQVQIWDTTKDGEKWLQGADKGSGGLWNNDKGTEGKDPLVHADRPLEQWNHIRLRLVGSRVWVILNDQLVVDGALMQNFWSKGETPLPPSGPINLQTHGGATHWRNIFIREIDGEEANRILNERNEDAFTSIFDGSSFIGWKGATDRYEIVDGAFQSTKGGTLYTEQTYTDFIWRMEFKLPPGGNNGLAIRYPGKGNPAFSGMCELQILDSAASRYNHLDARQHHGSIYGKVAALRGYLRPQGEWNFQEVHVQGSQITVELNGNVILDTDQAQASDFLDERFTNEIPDSGHLGFAGHGPDVSFKNLSIQSLD
ncbi:3-keto-disaccharide hydrolase [Coraliomargarita sp. W4R53]